MTQPIGVENRDESKESPVTFPPMFFGLLGQGVRLDCFPQSGRLGFNACCQRSWSSAGQSAKDSMIFVPRGIAFAISPRSIDERPSPALDLEAR